MTHARPFWTFRLQDLSNGIKNASMRGVLTLAITFWIFGNPGGLPSPIFGSVSGDLTFPSKWGCDTTIETPHILNRQLPMVLLRDWIEIQGRINECNQLYSPISPCSQNPRSSHSTVSTFSLGWYTLHIKLKIPKVIKHELPHNHSKNPWHIHHLLCVGLLKKSCKTSRPFPDTLGVSEVQASRVFMSQ
jgi:hypothetical protein